MKPSEQIREVKATLMDRGWVQGTAQNSRGEVCLGKAVVLTSQKYGIFGPSLYERVLEAIFAVDGQRWNYIPPWNDRIGRTFTDVGDVLDRAEKLALIQEEEEEKI